MENEKKQADSVQANQSKGSEKPCVIVKFGLYKDKKLSNESGEITQSNDLKSRQFS